MLIIASTSLGEICQVLFSLLVPLFNFKLADIAMMSKIHRTLRSREEAQVFLSAMPMMAPLVIWPVPTKLQSFGQYSTARRSIDRSAEKRSKYLVSMKAIIAKPCQQLSSPLPNLSSSCFLLKIKGGVNGDGIRGKDWRGADLART